MKKWILLLCIFLVGCQQSGDASLSKQTTYSQVVIHVQNKEGYPIYNQIVDIDFPRTGIDPGVTHMTDVRGDYERDLAVGQKVTLAVNLSSGLEKRTIVVPDHPVTETFVEMNPTSMVMVTVPTTIHVRTASGAPVSGQKIIYEYKQGSLEYRFPRNVITDSRGDCVIYLGIGETVTLTNGKYQKEIVVPDKPSEVTFIEQ